MNKNTNILSLMTLFIYILINIINTNYNTKT